MTYWRRLMGPIVFLACFGWTSGEPEPYLRAVDDEGGAAFCRLPLEPWFRPRRMVRASPCSGFRPGQQDVLQGNSKEARYRGLSSLRGRRLWEKGPQKNEGSSNAVSEMQLSLARSMGLVFQLEAIRYDRAHFRNSDISSEALMTRLKGGPLKAGRSGREEAQKNHR